MLLVWMLGCHSKDSGDTDTICVSNPALSYENFGKGFLDRYCTGCHSSLVPVTNRNGAPEGVDFNDYRRVITWRERILIRTLDTTSPMPPGTGPSQTEFDLLTEWIGCQVESDAATLTGETP